MCAEYQSFRPELYARELSAVLGEIRELAELDERSFNRVLRRYPKDGSGLFSKSEIVRGFRYLKDSLGWTEDEESFLERIRMKPIRTSSGVAPVTVLSKPYPCPGECIFCPSDVRMPKSYLSDEPGAQRADQHRFDPYEQTASRLRTYHYNGHRTDKIELIVLGGTWSFYPEAYQIWFVKRCLEALNDFDPKRAGASPAPTPATPKPRKSPPMEGLKGEGTPLSATTEGLKGEGSPLSATTEGLKGESPLSATTEGLTGESPLSPRVDGRALGRPRRHQASPTPRTYNQVIGDIERAGQVDWVEGEHATWHELELVQRANETAAARCVGLSLETRPDHLSRDELLRLRRLGATKVQIGYQSLSDEVLALNKRGHDVAATRRAMRLLRGAGFKIHAHWMPNLHGSTPADDIADYERLFADPDFRPDELKIYPCSLIESAELMAYYESGDWRPYSHGELLEVLTAAMVSTPGYCRLTRVIRDIPGTDIVAGNKLTNFRELAEAQLRQEGRACRDIRAREIRHEPLVEEELELTSLEYRTSVGRELFLEYVTGGDRLAAFLRLSLPAEPVLPEEIAASAMIREVHVYGVLTGLGESGNGRSQHAGLGARLIERAAEIARAAGYRELAVISSIGTREYYRRLGFEDRELYQHRVL